MKTASEILEKHFQVSKFCWVENGHPDYQQLIDAMEEYAEQFKISSKPPVSGRSELLIAYTKWLRENNYLQTAPFPSLVRQFEAINSR